MRKHEKILKRVLKYAIKHPLKAGKLLAWLTSKAAGFHWEFYPSKQGGCWRGVCWSYPSFVVHQSSLSYRLPYANTFQSTPMTIQPKISRHIITPMSSFRSQVKFTGCFFCQLTGATKSFKSTRLLLSNLITLGTLELSCVIRPYGWFYCFLHFFKTLFNFKISIYSSP